MRLALRLGPRDRPVAAVERRKGQQEAVAAEHTERQTRRCVGLWSRRGEEGRQDRRAASKLSSKSAGSESRFSISAKPFVENRDLTPLCAHATPGYMGQQDLRYGLSRTSRTFFNRSSREKGFARKSDDRSGSRLPGYPEMHNSFSERRRPRR